MSGRTLALFEQGLRVRRNGGRLRVERGEEVVTHVRLEELDEVLAFGDVQLSADALHVCLERNVDVQLLTERGAWRGRWIGRPGRRVEVRIAQFQRLTSAQEALRLARPLVVGKLANQRNLLLRAQRTRADDRIAQATAELRMRIADAERAPTAETLRGVEGLGAVAYFQGLAACLTQPELAMHGRSRRPPRDPPNAVLSFGYTLLLARLESAILRCGLDPYLGALHAPGRGQPSLALDLMEEFRPVVVDSLLLRLINRRELAPEDFALADPAGTLVPEEETDPGTGAPDNALQDRPGIWLGETGRRIFFRAWGRRLNGPHEYPPQERALTLEEILRQQVLHFARVLLGEDREYVPYVPR